MSTNGTNTAEDADMSECDGEKVVTMMDVLQEQEEFEEDANAVLGASDDKNCTYSKGYIKRQAIYACLTCCVEARNDPSKRAGVCLACSLTCHENHELVELYTKRNFCCDCGNPKFNSHPCQYTPDKPELNEDNSYNQNFSGLYCICHRPYPDPDNTNDDEMIQCIICEDWLHSSHLDAIVPNEQYAEMICKGCMEKNEFIHDYSEFAVNNELNDVDIMTVNSTDDNAINATESNGTLEQTLPNGAIKSSETNNEDETKEEMAVDATEKENDVTNEKVLNNESSVNEGEPENVAESTNILDEKMETDDTEEKVTSDAKDTEKSEETNAQAESNDITAETMESEATTTKVETDETKTVTMESEPDKDITKESANESENKIDDNANRNDETACADNTETDKPKEISDLASETEQKTTEMEQNNVTEDKEQPVTNSKENDNNDPSAENDKNKQISGSDTKENIEMDTSENKVDESPDKSELDSVDEPKIENEAKDPESNQPSAIDNVDEKRNDNDSNLKESTTTENEMESTPTESGVDSVPSEEQIKADPVESAVEAIPADSAVEATPGQNVVETNPEESTEDSSNTIKEPIPTESEADSQLTKDTDEPRPMESEADGVPTNTTDESQPAEGEAKSEPIEPEAQSATIESETPQNTSDQSSPKDDKTEDSEVLPNVQENKRKLSTETSETEKTVSKKAKLECVRPKGIKKRFKGATFWPSNFRQKLCTCNECISMYKDLSVLFLIDPEDTVTAYETLGKEKINGAPASQYEKGLLALSSLDRVQQINALTEYNKMRDKLLDFLKSFKDRKEIVKEEDIKAFFAGMKPKREPDGVYFCR